MPDPDAVLSVSEVLPNESMTRPGDRTSLNPTPG